MRVARAQRAPWLMIGTAAGTVATLAVWCVVALPDGGSARPLSFVAAGLGLLLLGGLELARRRWPEQGASPAAGVVVLDLGGAILDSDLGAVVLEQVLEAIEQRGADTILTGVSPISEPVVADLEIRRLVVHKDLPEAVAAAFQIADAQQRVY